MKTFETLQQVLEYIPHCIICKKELELRVVGSIPSRTNQQYFHRQSVCLKMFMLEDRLHSRRCKDFSLIVNPADNQMSSGKNLINDMLADSWSGISVIKKCKTCNFSITARHTNSGSKQSQKMDKFPSVELYSEELHYTMKKEKPVRIHKIYQNSARMTGESTIITVNHRQLREFNLDLSKIQDLNHLNNKIKTVMVFQ